MSCDPRAPSSPTAGDGAPCAHPPLCAVPGNAPPPTAAAASEVGAAETKLGCRKRKKFATKSLTGMIHTSLLQRDVSICQVFHLGLAKDHQPKAPKSRNLTIKALAQSKSNIWVFCSKRSRERNGNSIQLLYISSSFIYLAGCKGKCAAIENNDTSS